MKKRLCDKIAKYIDKSIKDATFYEQYGYDAGTKYIDCTVYSRIANAVICMVKQDEVNKRKEKKKNKNN